MADGNKGDFSFDEVHETLQTLETYYEDFYRAVDEMDRAVAESIDVGSDSAILGARASELINNWTNYCSGYKSYYNMFRTWSGVIISAGESYTDLESTYQSEDAEAKKLGDIDRTITSEDMKTFEEMHNDAVNAAALIDGNATMSSDSVTVNGTSYPVHTGANGEKYIEIGGEQYYVSGENGKVTQVKDSNGTTLTHDNMESQLQAKKDSMSESDWNAYKNTLSGEERAAADYLDTGTTLISSEQATQMAKDEGNPVPQEYRIDVPSTLPSDASDSDVKAAARQLLDSARETESYAYATTEAAVNYQEYYDNYVRESETYKNMSPEQQNYYDQYVESYCQQWSDIYNSTQSATRGGAFESDGSIYDAQSAYKHGETRSDLYAAAVGDANDINSQIDAATSPVDFYEEMSIFNDI